jgi:hypothetical protein
LWVNRAHHREPAGRGFSVISVSAHTSCVTSWPLIEGDLLDHAAVVGEAGWTGAGEDEVRAADFHARVSVVGAVPGATTARLATRPGWVYVRRWKRRVPSGSRVVV